MRWKNDVNIMSGTSLAKQWRQRQSGAIWLLLTARKLLNISRNRNSNVLNSIQDWRQVAFDDFACIYFVEVSVRSLVWSFFDSRRKRKMAARFFFQVDHLAKVVLLWTCLLNSVQYENLLKVFFQCKLNGTISWLYNNYLFCLEFLSQILSNTILPLVFRAI